MSKLYENIQIKFNENDKNREIVSLYPHQIGNNLYTFLKKNLKEKLEGKCNQLGYIIEIFKINKYRSEIINPSDFSGNCKYSVDYECRICKPEKNQLIIGKVINIIGIIALKNGPIDIIIKTDNINSKKFKMNNNIIYYIDDKNKETEIKKNDLLKLRILDIKIFKGDNKIFTIGYLEDIADEEDKKIYFEDMHYKKNISDEKNVNEQEEFI